MPLCGRQCGGRWTVDGRRPAEAGTALQRIAATDLGDIKSIFREFYERTVAGLPAEQQETARRLVEDLLIKDGVRIPYAAQALLAVPEVTQDLLDRLADASLLRVERDEQGRMLYEVGHDTLVAPISEAAQARREQEAKERLQREADEQRREKEQAVAARRRARLVAAGAIALAIVALLALVVAWVQYGVATKALKEAQEKTDLAKEQKEEADRQKIKADSSAQLALEKTKLAEEANKTAQQNLQKATQEEARAKAALKQVEQEKAATEAQRQAALRNYDVAQEQTKKAEAEAEKARQALLEVEKTTVQVVRNILDDASGRIKKLDYLAAAERLHNAARLVENKSGNSPLAILRPAIADSLLEVAYFFAETGNYAAAMLEADFIARMLERTNPTDALHDQLATATTLEEKRKARGAFRAALRQLCPAAFQAAEEKYYPLMLPVPGGTFNLAANYRVTLSDYQLARTETTVWQYNLYLSAQGKDIFDEKTIPRPGWGWEGDNPIVNVSWYDAVRYANWTSEQRERTPAYTTDTTGGNFRAEPVPGSTGFCLPSEAEWEYAARGAAAGLRDSFLYAGGNQLDLLGWYIENSGNHTHPVAQLQANSLGLYDMSGNVWEWCWDWYAEYPSKTGDPVINPTGPDSGSRRCLRGGSWYYNVSNCRPTNRGYGVPDLRIYHYGFRLARHF